MEEKTKIDSAAPSTQRPTSTSTSASTPTTANAATSTARSDRTTPPVQVALFTVMGMAIHTAVSQVIDQREDLELAVVVTCPGPKSRRCISHLEVLKAMYDAGHYNTDVVVCNKKSRYAQLMLLYKIDMILSIGYPWLLPVEILTPSQPETYPASPRLGALNIHNSLLPEYKGPNSFGWAIVNGDTEFGFCAHRMDGTFDTGSVLLSWTVPDDDVNVPVFEMLMPKLQTQFPQMVGLAIDKMIAGDPGTPQVGEGSHAPKFSEEFRWIDFAASTALEVHRKVRAFVGGRDLPMGALAIVEGIEICITITYYRDDYDDSTTWTSTGNEKAASPGTIVSPRSFANEVASRSEFKLPSTFFIQCKHSTLEVLQWEKQTKTTD
mmetsp:Transcript_25754/g.56496  ORF Transcript_25754/g.56496 Transcript_25754/m.56496 type:complete len:379 (-) Transcript_25754:144-1280(-)|eukprot:CAMPEP_0168170402 /NCGR_PEP_ID=MMETSP0139_2-20121125/4161_1 /TAXON_ID=44445 /ORGANISM="Pseudo-nitzschia australis, Strain 10249 10 AB" /LENGTH=378 /DNA_ID=CAMNT_0008087903 /DNA_START=100 /DNA_END=1236 /DNA_ORIENTATION=-